MTNTERPQPQPEDTESEFRANLAGNLACIYIFVMFALVILAVSNGWIR